jgi:hypothetical protein
VAFFIGSPSFVAPEQYVTVASIVGFRTKDFPFTIQLAILSLMRAVDGHRRAEAR